MIELVKFETKKIFSRKVIYIGLVLFIVLNSIYLYNSLFVTDYNLYQIPEEYQIPVSSELMNKANDSLEQLYSDNQTTEGFSYNLLSKEVKKSYHVYHAIYWADEVNTLQRNMKAEFERTMREFENKNSDKYSYNKVKLHSSMLNHLETPYIFHEKGWEDIISFISRYGVIFVSVMILLGISPVFTNEYTTNMDSLLLSSKKGKSQLISAKIIASTVYVIVIALFFTLLNTLPYLPILAKYGWQVPIQNLYDFRFSPYGFTIAGYFIVQFLVHLLGSIIFSLIVLLISSLSRSVLAPIFIGGSIWGIPLFLEYISYMKNAGTSSFLNYTITDMMKSANLFSQFKTLNIFSYPILYPYVMVILYTLLAFVLGYSIYYSFRNRQVN